MTEFSRIIQLRWSDLDPNFHVRHSVYYDWGAFVRIEFLNEFGLTAHVMEELKFGPILFKEECVFRREIRSGDEIKMNLQLIRSKKRFCAMEHPARDHKNGWNALRCDYRRWCMDRYGTKKIIFTSGKSARGV